MKTILTTFLIFTIAFVSAQQTEEKSKKELRAEKKAKQIEEIKALVDSKTFVFDATNVNPMRGRTRNLT